MNYTENYHLPQWEETDRVMRTDFNQMCADIESGISETAAAAAAAHSEARASSYVVGTYYGNGNAEWKNVNVGFRPRFLIITAQGWASSLTGPLNSVLRFALIGEKNAGTYAELTDQGFSVRNYDGYPFPELNRKSTAYNYIAFR